MMSICDLTPPFGRNLPPATRHFRTWIPLASRKTRPEHVTCSSWALFRTQCGPKCFLGGVSEGSPRGLPAKLVPSASWSSLGSPPGPSCISLGFLWQPSWVPGGLLFGPASVPEVPLSRSGRFYDRKGEYTEFIRKQNVVFVNIPYLYGPWRKLLAECIITPGIRNILVQYV